MIKFFRVAIYCFTLLGLSPRSSKCLVHLVSMLLEIFREFGQADRIFLQLLKVDLISNFIRPQLGIDLRVPQCSIFRFLLTIELEPNFYSTDSAQLLHNLSWHSGSVIAAAANLPMSLGSITVIAVSGLYADRKVRLWPNSGNM
ncbi:hypothetical protein LB506_001953 [Fusarium annulatum]|nr:hypothetical protein LB506_001953 [Fusarium annulatum]